VNLYKFTPQRGAKFIVAQQLDFNFARLTPLNPDGDNSAYKIVQTPNGWMLDLRYKLPPRPLEGTYVLGCVAGKLEWLATEECA
jgi:hypothetical protein